MRAPEADNTGQMQGTSTDFNSGLLMSRGWTPKRRRDEGSPLRPARSGTRVASYCVSNVISAGFGEPQPVTRSNLVPEV
jgi:hypothetical protein